ncbi:MULTISPECIES: GNAT family N-acetyltransferase [unclassified Actinotalea]|uniref:GNAT family N-acetyltransferase n=1 Tax=unclassified Actinotalea TaxID=2638618 RepID=UPI0015F6A9B1|nr:MULTISPECIES: GNAT family N-acetyltransferase [unclassified Actinotalea]
MVRGRADVRPAVVTDVDLRAAAALCALDPVATVLAASRIELALAAGSVRGGSALWGVERGGRLVALCWAGANVVPVCDPADDQALDAFAATALRQGRRCSSIVGPAGAVLGLWERLERSWGPARDVRAAQPSMVIDHPPLVAPDPRVRRGSPHELPLLLPACVQMFVEEVGYSPLLGSPGAYEARVRGLLEEGRSFVRLDEGPRGPEVAFKAELGAVSSGVAQVQGVWVPPDRRRQGLAAHGMAAVVQQTLSTVAPLVSLYVNDYNAPALATYERVGFRQVGTYATVLF